MATYRGKKTADCGPLPVYRDDKELAPEWSQALWNHSPDGFQWGYGGSGPAQLALALLLDATLHPPTAVRLHQQFKRDFVTTWGDEWEITDGEILQWVKEQDDGK